MKTAMLTALLAVVVLTQNGAEAQDSRDPRDRERVVRAEWQGEREYREQARLEDREVRENRVQDASRDRGVRDERREAESVRWGW